MFWCDRILCDGYTSLNFHIIKKSTHHIARGQWSWCSQVAAIGRLFCIVEWYCLTGTVSPPYMVKATPRRASYSDRASPGGLEFWLSGRIPVLGERGLSFACSHPSCTTRKAPLSSSPVYKEHLHGDQPLPVFVLCRRSSTLFRSGAWSNWCPEGFGCGASGMLPLWEHHLNTNKIDFSVNSKTKREQ